MPEGPTIVILREEAAHLVGRKVKRASGNTKVIDPQRLVGQKLVALRSFGKQFLMQFTDVTVRVHFMLFGRYLVDQRREVDNPRLRLEFTRGGEISLYGCSVRMIEGDLDAIYDWSGDIMSEAWSPRRARAKLKAMPNALACDALLDQDVFAGSGNIIKNEVLYRIRVHPLSRVGNLPPRKLGEMIKQARAYSFDFYEWKKRHELRKHWCVHAKSMCPRCKLRLTFAKSLGIRERRAFFCGNCQVAY